MGIISFIGGASQSYAFDVSDRASALDGAVQTEGEKARNRLAEILGNARTGILSGDYLAMVAIAIGFYELIESYKRYTESIVADVDSAVVDDVGVEILVGAAGEDVKLDNDDAVAQVEGGDVDTSSVDAAKPEGSPEDPADVNSADNGELHTSGSTSASFDSAAVLGIAPMSAEFIFDAGSATRVLLGGAGDDRLIVDLSADIFVDGGAGQDTAVFTQSALSVNFSITDAELLVVADSSTGAAATLANIETVAFSEGEFNIAGTLGSNAGNTIVGTEKSDLVLGFDGDDDLSGGDGDDIVIAGDGDDVLSGGEGKDILVGGDGADIFRFELEADQGDLEAVRDIIYDFVHGVDKIDLSGIIAAFPETFDFSESLDNSMLASDNAFMMFDLTQDDQIVFYWVDDIDDIYDKTVVHGKGHGNDGVDNSGSGHAFEFELRGLYTLGVDDFIV